MAMRSFLPIFNQAPTRPKVVKMPLWKAMAFASGFGLSVLSCPVHAAPPPSGGDTVQGLYDALLSTMKNGRILGQSGRFAQLAPVIRSTFDIPAMTRLSVGPTWAGLTEGQRQQVTESFGRYISAIYADRFDSYAGQKLQVTGEQPNAGGVMVSSHIIKANGEPVKVDYMAFVGYFGALSRRRLATGLSRGAFGHYLLSRMMSVQACAHSLQMNTVGPEISYLTQ